VYAAAVSPWLALLFAAALLLALVVAARRAATVLVLRVEAGRVIELRGRAPGELLRDLEDVFEQSGATGRLELRLDEGGVAVHSRDLDAATQQRVRNVVGRFPAARLKGAPRIRAR
jgi:hypothetical protein